MNNPGSFAGKYNIYISYFHFKYSFNICVFILTDEFRRVKASEHYESINSVGGQHISEATSNQPSTSSAKQSPVKSNASVSGVLVSNKQVVIFLLIDFKYF